MVWLNVSADCQANVKLKLQATFSLSRVSFRPFSRISRRFSPAPGTFTCTCNNVQTFMAPDAAGSRQMPCHPWVALRWHFPSISVVRLPERWKRISFVIYRCILSAIFVTISMGLRQRGLKAHTIRVQRLKVLTSS